MLRRCDLVGERFCRKAHRSGSKEPPFWFSKVCILKFFIRSLDASNEAWKVVIFTVTVWARV